MQKSLKFASLALVLVAGAAIAADGVTNPTVLEREAVMKANGKAMGVLGGMASGKTPFDATAAAAAKADLIAAAKTIPAKFEAKELDPKSTALPKIWEDWDDFTKDAAELVEAAESIDTASLDGVKAGVGKVGAVCKDCHTEFRSQ